MAFVFRQFQKYFSFFSSLVMGLKCWGCISTNKPVCGEPFESNKLHTTDYRDCDGMCAKLIYTNSDSE